jgi:hypothetical protein
MARHLPTSRCRVRCGTDGLQEQFGRADAERKYESTVPVVGQEPVVARPQRPCKPQAKRLVARTRDMEEPAALFLQSNFTVVEETRDKGQAIILKQLSDRGSAIFCASRAALLAGAFRLTVAV